MEATRAGDSNSVGGRERQTTWTMVLRADRIKEMGSGHVFARDVDGQRGPACHKRSQRRGRRRGQDAPTNRRHKNNRKREDVARPARSVSGSLSSTQARPTR